MHEEYAQRYRELYDHHWWWRARERFVFEQLRGLAPPGGFGYILDVGCGDGLSFDCLARFGEPEGIECEPNIVSDRGRSKGRIHIGSFGPAFRPAKKYGLVFMLDVLEHLSDPVGGLAHAGSLLEPNGLILLTVPAFRCLWTSHDDFNQHNTRYRRSTLLDVVSRAGLVADRCEYFFHWLFLVKIAVRIKEKIQPRSPQMISLPRPAVNRMMYGLSRCEQLLFSRLVLPWGNSIFAVLRLPGAVAESAQRNGLKCDEAA